MSANLTEQIFNSCYKLCGFSHQTRKIALQNAFEHDGKTKDKVVLSKILGTIPEYRNKVKEIIGDISKMLEITLSNYGYF